MSKHIRNYIHALYSEVYCQRRVHYCSARSKRFRVKLNEKTILRFILLMYSMRRQTSTNNISGCLN
jgi:hypothetical protein